MGRIPKEGDVIQTNSGIWYARFNGKRKTPNTSRAAFDLLAEMRIDAARPVIAPDSQGNVIILRGLPGSGKTTWAQDFMRRRRHYNRISRDDLRQMFKFGYYSTQQEKLIREIQTFLIMEVLRTRPYLVVDNTNLRDRDIHEIKDHAVGWWNGAPKISIEVLEFHTPLDECIRRDSLRSEPIGAERINEMYQRWQYDCDCQTDEERATMAARIEQLRQPPAWARDDDL